MSLFLAVSALLFVYGCGSSAVVATSEPGPNTTVSSEEASISEVFSVLAREVAPMPVYGLSELAAGVVVAEEWVPAIDMQDPGQYSGELIANPRISGAGGTDPEVQLVLRDGNGWLVVVENFRGDLGDVTGEEVGSVGGHTATLYEVDGGLLVQWSDGGRWYGVFGRDVARERVVQTALGMQLVEVEGAP
jgi:hypothetical protein